MSNRFDNLVEAAGRSTARCSSPAPPTTGSCRSTTAKLCYAAANEPKHFFRDEGSDHNDPLPDAFWDELRDFLANGRA